MGIKGSRNRVNTKKFRDNAEASGIPDLSLRNVDTDEMEFDCTHCPHLACEDKRTKGAVCGWGWQRFSKQKDLWINI